MVIHDHGARNWPTLSGNHKRLLMLANSHLVRQIPAIEHLRAWIPTMVGRYSSCPFTSYHSIVIRESAYTSRLCKALRCITAASSALLTNISPISLPN
ncbi:hypothetical protein BD309DRAFT_47282, partial [Dichomitus squalens]